MVTKDCRKLKKNAIWKQLITEKVSQDSQVETFRNYAKQGYKIIVGHGGEFYDAAAEVAKEYPDVSFIVDNATKGEGNVSGMAVSYPDQGYLAGALAALMTKSNKVAIILAEPIPLAEAGAEAFKKGVESIGKDVTVDVVTTGSWDDVNKAREAALAEIGNGVDVVFHILDTADVGVLTAAQDEGVMAIGLYVDESSIAPDAVIGSALGSPASLVYEAVCGNVSNGKSNYLDVNTPDGVSMLMTDLVPSDIQEQMQQITEDLKSGKITLP